MGFAAAMRDEKRWWWNRNVVMMLWVMLSATSCIGFHSHLKTMSLRNAEERLTSMCEERARMLQEQFAVSVNHVHALAILVSTFHYQKNPPALDQETFADYTARTAFERPLLDGVAYAKRVAHAERDLFENQQGWTIKTMKQEPSPVQDEYAPVIYSEKTVSYIKALDMMSGEEDRENILRARATGKAVLTRPFKLLESNHLGVVLTFPVYWSILPPDVTMEERVKATAGYLGGAFDVESLVENLLRQLAGNHEIMVNVYDATNASEPLIMYGVHPPNSHMSPSHVFTLDFGDPLRKHHMECRFRKNPTVSLSSITTPSGIFVICMLVGYIAYAAKGHYDNVKEDFHKMEELKKQAEAADVAKSQFLATVSHEIRTPMNGVLGMLDMLLNTDLNFTQKDCTQTAQVCGKALISLINEVLDRAKIESGKLELEAVPFDPRSIADDVVSLFSAKSREKGIELAVYVSDKVPSILVGDPGRFQQIITNLVGNSVKFTERGHVFVQVHLAEHVKMLMDAKVDSLNGHDNKVKVASATDLLNTLSGIEVADSANTWDSIKLLPSDGEMLSCTFGSESASKVTLVVSVEDTGIGIPTHAQDQVFAPFMQADSSTSRNYGGTGIGLNISKCLVELMGGKINFVSRPQIGSTFTFTVEFQVCEKGAAVDRKISYSEVLPTCFRGMRAALLDKRQVRAAVTKYHLSRLGINVHTVSTLDEALSKLSEEDAYLRSSQPGKQPFILLIEKDLWDPKIKFRIKNQLLERGEGCHVRNIPKVVLLSSTESDRRIAGSHVDAIIVKPMRASIIATCFREMLGMEKYQNKDTLNGSAFLFDLLDGKNILVVDDNKVNLRIAAAKLTKYGAKVECVESGKGALALLQLPHKFDACFMDVQMPEMDGFEATRQIRLMESEAYKEAHPEDDDSKTKWRLPILAMTADVMQETYEECVKCGMDGYVSKPIEEAQLYQAVTKYVVA
ncbi:putative histidine kinase 4 isoform X2 [Canna indica]|uniref:histidine kinase n=1 Tax=Canna indica TaxID=4628 RepID=A0AAQ3KUH6_9LILI|nr:putative histidine kinase 4 isoform X2 [Canna indica]